MVAPESQPEQDILRENDAGLALSVLDGPQKCSGSSNSFYEFPGPGMRRSNTSKVIYIDKLRVMVTPTMRPLVLKYRPCPSEKNSLFDNARRYVAANNNKIAYTEYNTGISTVFQWMDLQLNKRHSEI